MNSIVEQHSTDVPSETQIFTSIWKHDATFREPEAFTPARPGSSVRILNASNAHRQASQGAMESSKLCAPVPVVTKYIHSLGQKILIIEDDALFRDMLVRILRHQGFDPMEAENGRAGVRLARVYMPDLILCDVKMEGFDGYAALAAIRYQPITATIPVIMMTGGPTEQDRRCAMELGADDYLVKPFQIDSLLATIHVLLKRKETIKQSVRDRKQTGTDSTSGSAGIAPLANLPPSDPPPSEMPLPGQLPTTAVAPDVGLAQVRGGSLDATRELGPEKEPVRFPLQSQDELAALYLKMLNRFHPNLGNTAVRAVALCQTMGGLLELSTREVESLSWAAALHDISLMGLEREAVGRWLRDPRKVTEDEEAYIKNHPLESELMLEDSPQLKAAGPIMRAHHEKWDGTGYPDRLAGTQIPELARLLSAAVYYCSQHRLGELALKMLRERAGTFFDPEAVEAVAKASLKADIPRGIREILLNDMKPGQVVARDVHNATGMVLLRRDRELDETLINRVKAVNRANPFDQAVLVYC